MKKSIALFLSIALLCSCLITPAAAAETEVHGPIAVDAANGSYVARSTREELDLGTSGYAVLSIQDALPNQVRVSQYEYRTNSTYIHLKIKSNIDTSVKVSVINAETNTVFTTRTLSVGTLFYERVQFGTFSYLDSYYFKFENLGDQKVNLTGNISATQM